MGRPELDHEHPKNGTANATADGLRVLVIEDNRDGARALGLLLRLWGHAVRIAHDGAAGLKTADDFQPQVVLSDIGLPGLDGWGVARALRRDPATAGARLIAVTGYGTEADRQRSREAGFDHHLTKPCDPCYLGRLLET